MKVIRDIREIKQPFKNAVVAVGIFDGVHIGHQFILNKIITAAEKIKGRSVVVTFVPHPLKILNPSIAPALLTSLNHRVNLIAAAGIDVCLIVKFTPRFCRVSPQNFIENILVERIGMREIFAGDNFRFGGKGEGDIKLLRKMGRKFNFKVNRISPVRYLSRCPIISSTQIRLLIERGKIEQAAHFLGRPVSILGTVIKGNARGRWLGYPTANINPEQEAIPPGGVYAVNIKLGRRILFGILNIGTQPTFSQREKPTIEAHIFNFKQDLYARELEINFIQKLRNERKFANRQLLAKQIERDCTKAKRLLVQTRIIH